MNIVDKISTKITNDGFWQNQLANEISKENIKRLALGLPPKKIDPITNQLVNDPSDKLK